WLPAGVSVRGRSGRRAQRAWLGSPLLAYGDRDAARLGGDLRARAAPAVALRAGADAARPGAAAVRPGRPRQVGARGGGLPRDVAARPPRRRRRRALAARSSMPVTTIAVLGAGIMGRGIAYAAAHGGFRTLLQDTNQRALEQGVAEIWATFEKG